MRPRSFDRGEIPPPPNSCRRAPGFNAAAVFRPRRAQGRRSVVDRRGASMRPRSFDRGERAAGRHRRDGRPASMRPRSFDRGEVLRQRRLGLVLNASMRPRSFDRGEEGWRVAGGPGAVCFNAAAVFRPRRVDPAASQKQGPGDLQCGRGLSTAESRPSCCASWG